MVLQAAFFKLANVIPVEDAVAHMKDAVKKTYGLKGEKIVNMNIAAVDAGLNALVEVKVKPEWTNLTDKALKPAGENLPYVIKNILVPINAQKGDDLPVSAFKGMEDGTMPLGTSATRSAASPPICLCGMLPSASSAICAPLFAPTPSSARSCWTRARSRRLPWI